MINFDVKTIMTEDPKKIEKVYQQMKSLTETEILVGIPEEKAPRFEGKGKNKKFIQGMNNATLLYIHTNGSDLNHLPPRPVVEPALEASGNKERIEADLKRIAELILSGQLNDAKKMMTVTGRDAVNMIQNWFEDPRNNWPPNAPGTVKAKLRKKTKSKKKRKELFNEYEAGEPDINRVLIDTGQMRNAMTYVIKENE